MNAFKSLTTIVILLSSCSTANKQFLSSQEIEYMNKYPKSNTSISIFHDKKAIKQNRKDGIYKMIVSDRYSASMLCSSNGTVIKAMALEEAAKVKKLMNYKEHYQFIDVALDAIQKNERKSADGEDISCSYTVRVEINDFSKVRISGKKNNKDATSSY